MPVESFVISLLDEETDEIEGVYLVDDDKRAPITRIPREQGLSGRVISTGEPLLLHGAETVEDTGWRRLRQDRIRRFRSWRCP